MATSRELADAAGKRTNGIPWEGASMATMTGDDRRNLCCVIRAELPSVRAALTRCGFTGWANAHGAQAFGAVRLEHTLDARQLHVVVYPWPALGASAFVAAAHHEPSATVDRAGDGLRVGFNVVAHGAMALTSSCRDRSGAKRWNNLPMVDLVTFGLHMNADYDSGSRDFRRILEAREPTLARNVRWLAPGEAPGP